MTKYKSMTTFNYFIHPLLQRMAVLISARIGDAMDLCKRTKERIWSTYIFRNWRVVVSDTRRHTTHTSDN